MQFSILYIKWFLVEFEEFWLNLVILYFFKTGFIQNINDITWSVFSVSIDLEL